MSELVLLVADSWICYEDGYAGLLVLHLLLLFKPLALRRNAGSVSLFYRYYFGGCSSELAEVVPLRYSQGRFTRYSDRFHGFSVTILTCLCQQFLYTHS